jgi:hypothetical protein
MVRREITSVVWYRLGHRIEVNYFEGESDHFEGDELVVSQMAENEGLWSVPSSEGTHRWVRP